MQLYETSAYVEQLESYTASTHVRNVQYAHAHTHTHAEAKLLALLRIRKSYDKIHCGRRNYSGRRKGVVYFFPVACPAFQTTPARPGPARPGPGPGLGLGPNPKKSFVHVLAFPLLFSDSSLYLFVVQLVLGVAFFFSFSVLSFSCQN